MADIYEVGNFAELQNTKRIDLVEILQLGVFRLDTALRLPWKTFVSPRYPRLRVTESCGRGF